VVDVGAGIGYWIDCYRSMGAARLTALELSPTAAERLRELFPFVSVINGDVTQAGLDLGPGHDVVSVMNVLLHVVDDAAFATTMKNLARMVAPGGHLIITDRFGTHASRPAPHVHLRPLQVYQGFFRRLGFAITHIEAVHFAMNGGLAETVARGSRRVLNGHRIEDRLARVLYLVDGTPVARCAPNLRLLIAQRPAHDRRESAP
jgi:SAM-dependent methyltransferase